jgi:formylglycine-generating enzyme required for sulfatase activity
LTDLVPVGSKPAGDGVWGQSDLGGNVWEWVLDWYASPYSTTTCNDCANLTAASFRVLRGGCFLDGASILRGADRGISTPSVRYFNVGLRCARTP